MKQELYYFDGDRLERAAAAYIEDGTQILRAERQRDVDGAKAFLRSLASAKLRVVRSNSNGITNDAPAHPLPVLDGPK